MITDITKNLDYFIVIIAAVVLYRWIGRPLAFKV